MLSKFVHLCMLLIAVTLVFPAGQKKKVSNKDKQYYTGSLNYFTKWKQVKHPLKPKLRRNMAHEDIESFLKKALNTTPAAFYGQYVKGRPKISIAEDEISVSGKPADHTLKIRFLFEVDDGFKHIHSISGFRGRPHFTAWDTVDKGRKQYNGLYRITDKKWYTFVNGLKFDLFLDMGNNRILGLDLHKPWFIYGFRTNFQNLQKRNLKDIRLRQQILKLDHKRFVSHNFRILPTDHAIEVFNVTGDKEGEFFNYIPIDFVKYDRMASLGQTVCTTNGNGSIYIAFACPNNPYRVWEYDRFGHKKKVMGHNFFPADVYEYPLEWAHMDKKKLDYNGISRLCLIHNLLITAEGNLMVCWSENKIARPHRGKDVYKIYLDVYDTQGKLLGRTPFKYGLPEYIDTRNRIYSRQPAPSRHWKIVVSSLNL